MFNGKSIYEVFTMDEYCVSVVEKECVTYKGSVSRLIFTFGDF